MKDIVIIGGGVVGTTIARELSKYKLKTILLEKEKDISMGATKANSAIVHGGYAESNETLKGRMCYQGRKQFKKLNQELNFGFIETGSLVITTKKEDLKKLKSMMENGILNGLTDLEIIGKSRILELEPNMNPDVEYALYCKGAGICSPYQMAEAMMENAIKNGVTLQLQSQVLKIEKTKDYFIIKTNKNEIKSKYIINAAGLNSGKIADMLGNNDITITPRSGQYILFNTGSGKHANHIVFQMPTDRGKGVLVTPTVHGNLLIGPDAINEEGQNKDTDVKRLGKIFALALDSFPKLDVKQFARSFAGVRAASSTGDFVIAEDNKAKGLINLMGIQSPGLTSAPAISNMVINILKTAGLELMLEESFDPYGKAIIEKQDKIPFSLLASFVEKEPGEKDRIVCRCEQVSEKTMEDALNRKIDFTTIDGMKRRTRAGMGYCQGNFCRPRVEEFMERSLKDSLDRQTDCENSKTKRVDRETFLDYYNNI